MAKWVKSRGNQVLSAFKQTSSPTANPALGDLWSDSDAAPATLYICTATGPITWAAVDSGGAGGSPGGSDTQVQFNDGSAFGGDAGLTYNKTTNTLTTDVVVAALTGNVTGNTSGSSGSCTGNSATVTTNANLTGHITSTGNAAVLGSFTVAQLSTALSDANISGTNTGDQTLPVKATGSEVNTGTDDAKFVTAKAVTDSNIAFLSDIITATSTTPSIQINGSSNDAVSGSGAFITHTPSYTLPANTLITNKSIRVSAHFSVTSNATATIKFQLMAGSTVLSVPSGTTTPSSGTRDYIITWMITGTAAAGAAANTFTAPIIPYNSSTSQSNSTAQPVALATNGTLALQVGSLWSTSAAGGVDVITLNALIVEVLG